MCVWVHEAEPDCTSCQLLARARQPTDVNFPLCCNPEQCLGWGEVVVVVALCARFALASWPGFYHRHLIYFPGVGFRFLQVGHVRGMKGSVKAVKWLQGVVVMQAKNNKRQKRMERTEEERSIVGCLCFVQASPPRRPVSYSLPKLLLRGSPPWFRPVACSLLSATWKLQPLGEAIKTP